MSKIEYVPKNWIKKCILDQSNPNNDANDLCLDGYLFKRYRVNKNTINCLCKNPFCSGFVTLSKNNDVIER